MIRIDFHPDRLEGKRRAEWERLIANAESAGRKDAEARARGETPKWKDKIWQDIRTWMFDNVFHGKCAYCEASVRVVDTGQGEHWRPKAEVTERDAAGDTDVLDPAGDTHPGYYWAAYDWRNLLPACKECNVGSASVPGKRGVFPIGGVRVFAPAEADTFERLNKVEQPLLLHPFFDEPRDHIDFNEYGQPVVKEKSESKKASPTIDALGLDRPALNTKRHELHEEMRKRVKEAMRKQLDDGPPAWATLADEFAPRRDFALARRKYVEKWYAVLPRTEFGESPHYWRGSGASEPPAPTSRNATEPG